MDIGEIKRRGRELTKGNLWNFWKVYLIVFLISFVVTFLTTRLFSNANETIQSLSSLITIGITAPFTAGAYFYLLNITRNKPFKINDLFKFVKLFLPAAGLMLLMSLFVSLWMLLFIIPGIIAALRYAMAMYIFVDGEESPLECIRKSKGMMKGYKGNLFLLALSFIGWIFLGALTLGLLYIWLLPYMEFTFISYYEELRKKV